MQIINPFRPLVVSLLLLMLIGLLIWIMLKLSDDDVTGRYWAKRHLTDEKTRDVISMVVKTFEYDYGQVLYNWFNKQNLDNLYVFSTNALFKDARASLGFYEPKTSWSEFWQKRENATELDQKNPEAGLVQNIDQDVPFWAVEKVNSQYIWIPLIKYVDEHAEFKEQFEAERDALMILLMRYDPSSKLVSWNWEENRVNRKGISSAFYSLRLQNTDENGMSGGETVIRLQFAPSETNTLFSSGYKTIIEGTNVFASSEDSAYGKLFKSEQLYKHVVKYVKDQLKSAQSVKKERIEKVEQEYSDLDSVNKKLQADFSRKVHKSELPNK